MSENTRQKCLRVHLEFYKSNMTKLAKQLKLDQKKVTLSKEMSMPNGLYKSLMYLVQMSKEQ